jgi:hypothetical protein
MPGQITELALVKAQRDQLAVNLHDLHERAQRKRLLSNTRL